MTSQDLISRMDITALEEVTGSELNQLVNAAYPADDKGLIIETTDTALDTAEVPDPDEELESVTPTYWTRYIWKRNPHATDDTNGVRLYVWNPNATEAATFLKWENINSTATEALALAESATADAAEALESATTAETAAIAATNAVTGLVSSSETLTTEVEELRSLLSDLQDLGLFHGTNNGSTTTSIKLMILPDPPTGSVFTGMKVTFISPVTCGDTPRVTIYSETITTGFSPAIKAIVKFNPNTRTFDNLSAGDIISGQVVEITYNGATWEITSPVGLTSIGNGTSTNISVNKNLVVQNNSGSPTTQIDIDADEVVVSSANSILTLTNVNLTIDSAVTGANGCDVIAIVNTWYHAFVIYNPTTNTTAGLISESATAPTLPTGYSMKAYVGSVYRSGSSFRSFYQRGTIVVYSAAGNVFDSKATGVAAGTYLALSAGEITTFDTYIPTTAKTWKGTVGTVNGSYGGDYGWGVALAANSTGLGSVKHSGVSNLGSFDFDGFDASFTFDLILKDRTDPVYWKSTFGAGNSVHRLDVIGYTL